MTKYQSVNLIQFTYIDMKIDVVSTPTKINVVRLQWEQNEKKNINFLIEHTIIYESYDRVVHIVYYTTSVP